MASLNISPIPIFVWLAVAKPEHFTHAIFCFFFSIIYCCRPHSSLNGFTPLRAHFDSHISAYLSRLFVRQHALHEKRAYRRYLSQKDSSHLKIGDKVLLRTKRLAFQKLSSVYYPQFQSKAHVVTSIDRKTAPFLYQLDGIADSKRRFYRFELLKLDQAFDSLPDQVNNVSKVFVKDVVFLDNPRLRSGKVMKQKGFLMYVIERNGKIDRVPEATLRLLKTTLGSASLVYDSSFQSRDRQGYII